LTIDNYEFSLFYSAFYLFFYFNRKVRKGFAKDAVITGLLLSLLTSSASVSS